MGTKERKEREMLIRKNDIIDAAERVFFEKGIQQSTMDEIAREAEFSKRTIYIYFQSKDQIYYEIMLRAFRVLNNMLGKSLENKESATSIEKINVIAETFIEFIRSQPNYFKVIVDYENQESDFKNQDKVITECYKEGEKSLNILKEIISKGIEEGSILENININYTIVILWSSIAGIFNSIVKKESYLRHYYNIQIQQLIEEAFEFMIRAIKK
ncbi:TetR/AcrR family transcriptional regulator [Clostridiaceae bacterium UIB06]|uniref:TetR/AcrR family transcriptional regulator n=2 Tax=Clostridium thailandense TaxID=2794346 RepID=A0A949WWF6_9CLOT|nr:TetR/AcrR family transcriptional regulator [Clostridium thailandense]MCH5137223.1 TetR/AcrR family transcriptional regulator [Clostridiaceae bacterium UIB06]